MIDKLLRLLRNVAAWFRRLERDAAAEISEKDVERWEDKGRIW
jgi:U3 small nucleolar RNA-associated protein 14